MKKYVLLLLAIALFLLVCGYASSSKTVLMRSASQETAPQKQEVAPKQEAAPTQKALPIKQEVAPKQEAPPQNQEITENKLNIRNTQSVSVLMYHHLLRKQENTKFKSNPAVMSVESFESQMKLLYDNGYQTITLQQLKEYLDCKASLPGKSIMITFDDGYKSNYLYAYPILKKYGFTAVQFLITSLIKNDPSIHFHPDYLTCFSKDEAHQSTDVFEFQSHTHNLHHKQAEKSFLLAKPRVEIISDLTQSHSFIQNINSTPIKAFAYPFGAYNNDTLNVLKELKYDMAFTTKEGRVKPGDSVYELKRFLISDITTLHKFKEIIGLK